MRERRREEARGEGEERTSGCRGGGREGGSEDRRKKRERWRKERERRKASHVVVSFSAAVASGEVIWKVADFGISRSVDTSKVQGMQDYMIIRVFCLEFIAEFAFLDDFAGFGQM